MSRKAKWLIAVLFAVMTASIVFAFFVGYYFGERYSGERIDGEVFVNGAQSIDGTIFETKYGDYVVLFGESQYWVRREGEAWNVGVIPGPFNVYGNSFYSRSVPLSGVFPPQAKTDPWDPKPRVDLNLNTRSGVIEFVSVRSERVRVELKRL